MKRYKSSRGYRAIEKGWFVAIRPEYVLQIAIGISWGLVIAISSARAAALRLEFADKVRMIEFGNGSAQPYFRMQLNVVDETGAPVSIPLPKDLKKAIEVRENGQSFNPFYVRYGEGTLAQAREEVVTPNRYAMLLMDISGSMLDRVGDQTKFEAAKAAAQRFLSGFHPGPDYVAVVPFESHNVEGIIRAAQFAGDLASVQNQILDLKVPRSNYNTGLYTATLTALDVLQRTKLEEPSRQVILVVLTDGQNQVLKGDDPGLLDGPEGLIEVINKANRVGIQILTIGFGDELIPLGRKGAIDSTSLRKMAWPTEKNFYMASDLQDLSKVFTVARRLLIDRLQVTFSTRWDDRSKLSAHDLIFQVRLILDDGRDLHSGNISFVSPQVTAPLFEGKLTLEEKRELFQRTTESPTPLVAGESPTRVLLRRLSIFATLGGILGFFWFFLPRFIWPERYIGPALSEGARVANEPQIWKQPMGLNADSSSPSEVSQVKIERRGRIPIDSQRPSSAAHRDPNDQTILDPGDLDLQSPLKPRGVDEKTILDPGGKKSERQK